MIELIIAGRDANPKNIWKLKGAIELRDAIEVLDEMVHSRKQFATRVLSATPGTRLKIGYGELPHLINGLAPFSIMTGSIPEPYEHTYTFSVYNGRTLHFSRFVMDVVKYAARYPEFCDKDMLNQLR
jgi:hypothetical protein